ncbi:hypothetical protein [Actinokineospora xionganensis]|uniref:Uncharacterized protein n=1 Tax=Actinokineospora xionganensis TaxID=2684470 RepID=A0ABR7LF01_9PSEU|nr:hypothetical protein [Actinokineospora xionganensis]MBC6450936.1 hypothetical protein [Actinokineospora xionganensis]
MSDAVDSISRMATGPTLYVAGQVSSTEDGSVPDSAVVKLTYFLRDLGDLAEVREVVRAVVPHPRPATVPPPRRSGPLRCGWEPGGWE